MAVEVQTTRKAVEIAWEAMGQGEEEGPKPPEFPPYPDNSLPGSQPRPDNTLPGEQPEVDNELPGDQPRPDNTLPGEQPRPSHPIYLPPYIDNSLPGNQPVIDNSLPEIEEIGLSEEQIEKLKSFLEGNLPPYEGRPEPTPVGGKQIAVQVFAQGQEGDWSNTAVMPNDGIAVLTYPQDWTGESYVEVRALDGSLVDSGTITVK